MRNSCLILVALLLALLPLPALAAGESWQWGDCPWSAGCDADGAILPPNGSSSMPAPVHCSARIRVGVGDVYVDGRLITDTVILSEGSVISVSNTEAITRSFNSL
ncbi:MAG: hypothetical protein U9Q82_10395, partial [Chloroflexota bacterium]|nr:hypothetical protein [Chloroflexota bacterium]